VISVDPAGTAKDTSDETGIVVMGQAHSNECYVFEDRTMRATPVVWGEAVWKAALDYGAAHILLEENYGQDMTENVLRSTWPGMAPLFARKGVSPPRIERVNAQGSKYTRAVAASAMYESSAMTKPRVHHVRGEHDLSLLEEELTGWIGTGDSPNRLDCVSQAVRWLMLGGDVRQAKQGKVVSGPRWGAQRKVGHR
jgi:phage terminase large subunit-like protein